jgi:hypothetical protein
LVLRLAVRGTRCGDDQCVPEAVIRYNDRTYY